MIPTLRTLLVSMLLVPPSFAASSTNNPPGPSPTSATSASLNLDRPHPRLFADAIILKEAKRRAAHDADRKAVLDSILKAADALLSAPLNIPDVEGQWAQHYICKRCSNGLAHRPPVHVCKKCKAEYTGWPYDQVVAGAQHRKNWHAVETLGLAYTFTGDTRFAEAGKSILLGYADKYTSYPLHDYKGGKGKPGARMLAQTLSEATVAIHLCWGYDLLIPSGVFSGEDRKRIDKELLAQVAKTILRNDAKISNWQSWHNAALLCIGVVTGDRELAHHALRGKSAFEFQLDASILKDGFWYEGAPAYHFYALSALRYTAEAARGLGLNYYEDPRFIAMFEAPIEYTFPNGSFPAVNDSRPFSIFGQVGHYETAYAHTRNETFRRVLERSGRRRGLEYLIWGRDFESSQDKKATAREPLTEGNHDFPGVGGVMLRDPSTTDAVGLHLDYGPHGGWHGHFEKLGIILYAFDKVLLPDAGNLSYASPLHKPWYKTTLAHNTLIVDGMNQAQTTATLEWMSGPDDNFAAAQATCDTAYPGVSMRRTVVLHDGWMVDVVTAHSTAPHTFDLAYHVDAELDSRVKAEPYRSPLGDRDGYQFLTDVQQLLLDNENWKLDFASQKQKLQMLGVMPNTMETSARRVFLTKGMHGDPPTTIPLVLQRQHGTSATFVSVVQTMPRTEQVERVHAHRIFGDYNLLSVVIPVGEETTSFQIYHPENDPPPAWPQRRVEIPN